MRCGVKIVVSGASGLLGRHLIALLAAQGDDVVALIRRQQDVPGARSMLWNANGTVPEEALVGAQAMVNLAGENIGSQRWTVQRRAQLINSRVDATRSCVRALGSDGPTVLVNASAVGYYGVTSNAVSEVDPPGDDFLAQLCVQWESEAHQGDGPGQRIVTPRLGVVLARDGGAFPRLRQVTAWGLGGPLGDGQQWMSWIHVDDAVNALALCVHGDLRGPVNVVAPEPVQQRELARALGRALHRPAVVPTPRFAVTLALGSGPASLALTGQKVTPEVLTQAHFAYRYASLDAALANLTS